MVGERRAGPTATTSSGALGFVLPAYRALLDATLLSTAFNVGDVWYTDNADRTAFELSHLKTPVKDCRLLIQQWVVSGEENPVLHHLAGPSHRPDLRLSFPVSAISAVLWSARGRPRAILKLRSYDYHNSALRKEVIRVEFRDNVHKTQFLHYMLPLVTTMMEKSPSGHWVDVKGDACVCPVNFAELDYDSITPAEPYVFVLKGSGPSHFSSVDWLTMSIVFDDPLDRRDAHVETQQRLPIANRLYRPGVFLIPAYNLQFAAVVSNYFADFGFPSHVQICIWWSADDGDANFRAHLGDMFRDGKTALHTILTTCPDCNLEQHCRGLDPKDPETADTLFLATPRAVAECATLGSLLSDRARAILDQEDEGRLAVSCSDGESDADSLARRQWEDGLEFGF
ncbi:hypothetical protein K4K59_004314 [Colletotrichum sp. SAR11_240]|nr:hypothetical protein K4K59_004314 [Colletotrichum sp. SAR11_240]